MNTNSDWSNFQLLMALNWLSVGNMFQWWPSPRSVWSHRSALFKVIASPSLTMGKYGFQFEKSWMTLLNAISWLKNVSSRLHFRLPGGGSIHLCNWWFTIGSTLWLDLALTFLNPPKSLSPYWAHNLEIHSYHSSFSHFYYTTSSTKSWRCPMLFPLVVSYKQWSEIVLTFTILH